jgi:hypothetical protein
MIKEDGTVAFDEVEQKEVDRIIQERIARVKAEKPADYDDLKEIAEDIGEFFEGATPAEKKAAIKAYKADLAAQKELEALEEQSKLEGTPPALLKEINDAKKAAKEANDKLAAIEAKETAKIEAEKLAKLQEENYQLARKELLEAHDVDADDLQKDEDFMEYIEGKKNINLVKEYEKFIKLTGKTAAEATLKYKSKESRSTSSGKGGNSDGATYGLTARQQDLAKKGGMTYKEYAELQSQIN